MTAVGDPAEEHRVRRRHITQFRSGGEHHALIDDQHLIAVVDAQQGGLGPAGDGGVDISTQMVGAVGSDPRQQRNVAQLEARRVRHSTSAVRMKSRRSLPLQSIDRGVVDPQ